MRFSLLITIAAVIIFTGSQAQSAGSTGESWKDVNTTPQEFRGRWAQMDIDGKIKADACIKDEKASADLVVGPTWILDAQGYSLLTWIQFSTNDGIRFNFAYSDEGKVLVNGGLMSLQANGKHLEFASSPEVGFEVSLFERCPSDA
jgi:opacity protein-like surface antigen